MPDIAETLPARQVQLRVRLDVATEARLVAWQLEALRRGMPKPTYGELLEQLIEFAADTGFAVASSAAQRRVLA